MLLEILIPSTLYTVYKSGVIGINWYKLYTGKELPSGDKLDEHSGYKELVCLDETRQIQRTPFMINTGHLIVPIGQGVEDTENTIFTKLVHETPELSKEHIEPRGFSLHTDVLKEKSYINTAADFHRFCEQYKVNPESVPIRLPLIKEVYKIPSTLPIYSSKQTVWVSPRKRPITLRMAITHSFERRGHFGLYLGAAFCTVALGSFVYSSWDTSTKWELKRNYPVLYRYLSR
jgi:hypothetical protein